MKKQHRNYSTSFKQKAVELSYARGHVKQVCEELDIPYSLLHRWRRESQDYGKNSFPGRGIPKLTDEQKEIALLKKQLRDILQISGRTIHLFLDRNLVQQKKNTLYFRV